MDNGIRDKTLNPFSLPPETNARFSLLLVSVIVLSMILGNYLPVYFLSDIHTEKIISPDVDYSRTGIDTQEDIRSSGMKMITNSLEYLPSIFIFFFIMTVTFLVTFIFYRRHASDIIRKKKLKPADDGRYSKLTGDIKNITSVYRTGTPEIYISPDFTSGAQAFGFRKRNMLRIDNGLRMLSYKNFPRFKGIILHETGHIINKDVSKTYISMSLWKSVLYIFAVPTLLIIFFSFFKNLFMKISGGIDQEVMKEIFLGSIPAFLLLVFSISFIFLLINLLLKSLVRTREYYADQRAAGAGAKEELVKLFNENMQKEKKTGRFKRLFSWHPDIAGRSVMLKDPSGLFILKNDICFIVGLLLPFSIFSFIILIKTGLTLTGLLTGTSQVISQDLLFTFVTVSASIILFIVICFIPFFITSYLISSSVGLQIQRNELVKISSAGELSFGLKEILSAAFVITCGMAAGCILLPYFSVLNILLEISLLDFLKDKLPLIILSFAIAYIINFFWIFYLKFFTGKVYGRYISEDVPLKRYYIFNAASALLFSVMILPAAGTFFRVYSEKVKLLNDVTDYLLIALPFIYIIFFAATAAVCGISNSVNKTCSACRQSTPQGILIGKNCAKCGEVFSRWLYI